MSQNGTDSKDSSKSLIEQIAERKTALDLKEFAAMYSVSYKTLFEMTKDGRLPCVRIGTAIRLDPAITVQWLRKQSTP